MKRLMVITVAVLIGDFFGYSSANRQSHTARQSNGRQ